MVANLVPPYMQPEGDVSRGEVASRRFEEASSHFGAFAYLFVD